MDYLEKYDLKVGDEVRVIRDSNAGYEGHVLLDNPDWLQVGYTGVIVSIGRSCTTFSGYWLYLKKEEEPICPSMVEKVNLNVNKDE